MDNPEVFIGICQACSFFPVLGITVVFKVQTWEMMCPALLRQIRPTALPQRAYILPRIEELRMYMQGFLEVGHQRGRNFFKLCRQLCE